jgi:Ca2+-binding EF-hand superfamily protein
VLSFPEFFQYTLKQQKKLRKSFDRIDPHGQGRISTRDLEKFASSLKLKLSHAEVTRLVKEIDRNNDGVVDFPEFCEYFLATVTSDTHPDGIFE